MAHFNHEKLIVYQKAISLVSDVESIITDIPKKPAARDQLRRAIMSIPINIAEANATSGGRASVHLIEVAIGSSLESAAALDVLAAREVVEARICSEPKAELYQVVGMLYGLRDAKSEPGRVREEPTPSDAGSVASAFDHERLDVYKMALAGVRFCLDLEPQVSPQLFKGYDRASTSVVLNIAEGNGRFAQLDRGRFLDIAKRSLLQAVAVLDVAVARAELLPADVEQSKRNYSSVFRMIEGLQDSRVSRDEEGGKMGSKMRSKMGSKSRDSVKYS